jgi:hypothetical protein
MAVTTIETNNKFIKFTTDINREFVRENMFSPYMGEELNSIIRIRNELKQGGETMNIPIVARLSGTGVTTGPLVGNEERIDNYGMRLRMDWARNAVVTPRPSSTRIAPTSGARPSRCSPTGARNCSAMRSSPR